MAPAASLKVKQSSPTEGEENFSSSCPDQCPRVLSVVCGSDGVTYASECHFRKRNCDAGNRRRAVKVEVASSGRCDDNDRRKPSQKESTKGEEVNLCMVCVVQYVVYREAVWYCHSIRKIKKMFSRFPCP